MPRPRREEFISDVRLSARMLQKPNVEADSDTLDTDAISRILGRKECGRVVRGARMADAACE